MYTTRTARELHARLLISMSVAEAKGILGFPPDYNPSPIEVTKAYRAKALKHHPDHGGDPKKMVEVNVAKEILDGKTQPDFESTPVDDIRRDIKDLIVIGEAKKMAVEAITSISLESFLFRSRNEPLPFLKEQMRVISLVRNHAEKGLEKPASQYDERVLVRVLDILDDLDKDIRSLYALLESLYRKLGNLEVSTNFEKLREPYAACAVIKKTFGDLLSKSKKLSGLLFTGLGPTFEDAISIPEDVCDRFHECLGGFESYVGVLESFDPKALRKIEPVIKKAVGEVKEIFADRGIDLLDNGLRPFWERWEIPGTFELAEEVFREKVNKRKKAGDSMVNRVVSRLDKEAAPRGKAQLAIMEYLKDKADSDVQLTSMSRHPSFRGVHLEAIQSAAESLKKQGLIEYDGKSLSKKAGDSMINRVVRRFVESV